MQEKVIDKQALIDGSRLIIESLARSGAGAYIGYPITPANLLYHYGGQRMDMMLAAPDEITTVQWMAGLAITGTLPVTATSFPGFALMVESVNMAYMMELPMVIVLVQRLGPATGTATCGAQGDLLLLKGMISGGHPIPVLATSSLNDCWTLAARAAEIAISLRTPVVLLTSKEEVMTQKSFDLSKLEDIGRVEWPAYTLDCEYKSYKPTQLVPDFLPVNQTSHQVRFNASTHDQQGILQHSGEEAMGNTRRLENKICERMRDHAYYEYENEQGAKTLLIAYGITALAAREAVSTLKTKGINVSLLIPKTILPVPDAYLSICQSYERIVIAEENINNQLGQLFYGRQFPNSYRFIGSLGKMISPQEIMDNIAL